MESYYPKAMEPSTEHSHCHTTAQQHANCPISRMGHHGITQQVFYHLILLVASTISFFLRSWTAQWLPWLQVYQLFIEKLRSPVYLHFGNISLIRLVGEKLGVRFWSPTCCEDKGLCQTHGLPVELPAFILKELKEWSSGVPKESEYWKRSDETEKMPGNNSYFSENRLPSSSSMIYDNHQE